MLFRSEGKLDLRRLGSRRRTRRVRVRIIGQERIIFPVQVAPVAVHVAGELLDRADIRGLRLEGDLLDAVVLGPRLAAGTRLRVPAWGAITLTDLIVSTDKANASSVTVRFTDGSNTINVAVFDSVNAPVALAIPFVGHWQGWQGARLEVVTTGNVNATVALGYYKIPKSGADNYSAWDAKR